jgi:hypothetical protein
MTTFKQGDRVYLTGNGERGNHSGNATVLGVTPKGFVRLNFDDPPPRPCISYPPERLTLLKPPVQRRLTVCRNTATSTMSAYATPQLNGDLDTVFEGEFDFEVEEIDPTVYVRVEYVKFGMRYTYIDPTGGTLHIGDEVEVPIPGGTKLAKVVAYGRDEYVGPCKTVAARIVREAF